MKSKRRLLFVMLCGGLSILTPSCASLTQTAGIEGVAPDNHANFCQIAKAISYSSRDTAQTREQIAEHNCVGHKLCGWAVQAATCPETP